MANDGFSYVNQTYSFVTVGNVDIIPSNPSAIGIAGVIGLLGFVLFFINRKRKNRR